MELLYDILLLLCCFIGIIGAMFLWGIIEILIDKLKTKYMSNEVEYVYDVGWYWKRKVRSDGVVIDQDTIPKTEYKERKLFEKRQQKLERIINGIS